MNSTIELLDQALQATGLSERALSQQIGLSPSNLSVARIRGNLSPLAAGQIAERVGAPIAQAMALAVIEGQPRSRATDRLRRAISAARKAA